MIRIFFFFLLLPHFYPLILSPLSQSSHSSFLPVASFNSSTRRQPKPLPSVDNVDLSPCPVPTTPTQAPAQRRQCWLISAISFFFYSVSQSFSIANTKTHDRRCWVLILSPWLTKQRCRRDWLLCWWVLFLFWWMGFDFVDGWWMVAGFLWFRGGFWLIWLLMMGSIFILMNEFWFYWWLMNGVC